MSDIEEVAAALSERFGPDYSIEYIAQLYDDLLFFPGVGDVLRNAWKALRPSFLALSWLWTDETAPAHELAYYQPQGGAAVSECDVVARIREAYEFYLLDSDRSAGEIFAQQVGQILDTQPQEGT